MSEGVIHDDVSAVSQLQGGRSLPGLRVSDTDSVRAVASLGRVVLVWFALLVVYGEAHRISQRDLVAVSLAALVWLLAFRATAVLRDLFLSPIVVAALGAVFGLGGVLLLDSSAVGLRASTLELASLTLAAFASAVAWDWFVDRTAAGRRRILLVGSSDVEDALAEELSALHHASFELLGAVAGGSELATIVESQRPDLVVLTDETAYNQALGKLLDARTCVRVTNLTSFCERALGRIPIECIGPAWFLCLLHPRQHVYSRLTKRAFDIVVALAGLVLAAPFLAVAATLTKLDGGPVLYGQTRIGEHGRRFFMHKIRTMRCDAEECGAAFCAKNDPRVTRLGRVLRRTHFDELPQLWNVLKGDMSIVGPRPERPEFVDALETTIPFWSRRLLVKPGVTGWAQVRSSYASDCAGMERKLSYDLWYLKNRSLVLDIAICFATLLTVGREHGS
jgi:exopolysaccharide biosynthesis polyprenyl glycosylphosphotransferase